MLCASRALPGLSAHSCYCPDPIVSALPALATPRLAACFYPCRTLGPPPLLATSSSVPCTLSHCPLLSARSACLGLFQRLPWAFLPACASLLAVLPATPSLRTAKLRPSCPHLHTGGLSFPFRCFHGDLTCAIVPEAA